MNIRKLQAKFLSNIIENVKEKRGEKKEVKFKKDLENIFTAQYDLRDVYTTYSDVKYYASKNAYYLLDDIYKAIRKYYGNNVDVFTTIFNQIQSYNKNTFTVGMTVIISSDECDRKIDIRVTPHKIYYNYR